MLPYLSSYKLLKNCGVQTFLKFHGDKVFSNLKNSLLSLSNYPNMLKILSKAFS